MLLGYRICRKHRDGRLRKHCVKRRLNPVAYHVNTNSYSVSTMSKGRFASRTAFEALAVSSGEESEEELSPELAPIPLPRFVHTSFFKFPRSFCGCGSVPYRSL